MSSCYNCVSNEADHTVPMSTRGEFQPDIPADISRMMNTQCGLDNSVNPECVVEESTCRDYCDKTSVERVFTIVNSTTAAKVPVAQASPIPSPDISSDPQDINMSENQEIQPVKRQKRKKGRLAKLFLRCSCTVGNDNEEDSFETKPRDEEVPNSTTLDTSTDKIRNTTRTEEPFEVSRMTVLEVHSVPSQNVEYHNQTVTSGGYDATVIQSVSRQSVIVEIHNSSSIVQVTAPQQHSESRNTDVLDSEVVSVNPLSVLRTVVLDPQNILLADNQEKQPIEHTLAPPMGSQDIEPCLSDVQEQHEPVAKISKRLREYTVNKDAANISLDNTRPCDSTRKENDDVKSNRSTERPTHSLNTDEESKQIMSQRSSGASPAELTKAEDKKVVNNNKPSLREQSAATMKKVVSNIKTSLREQPAAKKCTKADNTGETNPNALSQTPFHKRSDDHLMENVLKRHRDGTWYVLRRYKKHSGSRSAVCEYDDDLPIDQVNAANNDVIVKSSEEDCNETKESEQKRMCRKTMNKYTDDLNLGTTKVAKRVHFSSDPQFNSPEKNEASTKRSEHSVKSVHSTASVSTPSLNESHKYVKKVVYISRGTQTSPEGAVFSSKGSRSSANELDVLPKKESNETDSSEEPRRYRRKMPSKSDRYQLMAEL